MEKLTPFQNVLTHILINKFGFTHKYDTIYTHEKGNFSDIDVSKLNYWEDVLWHFFADGSEQKRGKKSIL